MAIKNRGNLSEGILGAAIMAKVCARGPNGKIRKVGVADIKQALLDMKSVRMKSGGKEKIELHLDVGRKAQDKITLVLRLGKVMLGDLLNAKNLDNLNREMAAAASYVNSPKIEAFAEAMYNNDIDNKIEVDVDGITNSMSTKSDITLKADRYTVEKISLKSGKATGNTIGQIGGNTWTSILRLFHGGINAKTSVHEAGLKLPLNTKMGEQTYMGLITEEPNYTTVKAAVKWAYKTAEGLFNGASTSTLVKTVHDFLIFHSTRGDTDVKIVMFHLGKHKTLVPGKLKSALAKLKKIRAVSREDGQWSVFLVYDAAQGQTPSTITANNVLFVIRPKADTRTGTAYIYHIVEEGPLFTQLIEEK